MLKNDYEIHRHLDSSIRGRRRRHSNPKSHRKTGHPRKPPIKNLHEKQRSTIKRPTTIKFRQATTLNFRFRQRACRSPAGFDRMMLRVPTGKGRSGERIFRIQGRWHGKIICRPVRRRPRSCRAWSVPTGTWPCPGSYRSRRRRHDVGRNQRKAPGDAHASGDVQRSSKPPSRPTGHDEHDHISYYPLPAKTRINPIRNHTKSHQNIPAILTGPPSEDPAPHHPSSRKGMRLPVNYKQ